MAVPNPAQPCPSQRCGARRAGVITRNLACFTYSRASFATPRASWAGVTDTKPAGRFWAVPGNARRSPEQHVVAKRKQFIDSLLFFRVALRAQVGFPRAGISEKDRDGHDQVVTEQGLATTVFLVRRAKDGDQSAFTALYERHYARVRRSAALRMGKTVGQCEQDIDDVVQEAFIYAFDVLTRGDFDETRTEGGFRNWLANCIVEGKIKDRARRRGAAKRGGGRERVMRDMFESTIAEPPAAAAGDWPSQLAASNELAEGVERALLLLSDRHRTILDLRDNCEMTFEEIAGEMGYNKVVTMRSLYRRAREELRKVVAATMPGWESLFQ